MAVTSPPQIDERFALYRRSRDRQLRNSLVVDHGWLARSCARRFAHRGEPFDDLVQVAQLGIIKAVERYDPSYGVPFPGFALPTVLGEIRRHFRDRTWVVAQPRRVKELAVGLSNEISRLEQQLGRPPTVEELGGCLGVTADDIVEALEARRSYRLAPLGALAGDDGDDVFSNTERDTGLDRVMVQRALATLSAEDRAIVVLRFYAGLSQLEIAERLGQSQSRVSRRLRELFHDLRQVLAS